MITGTTQELAEQMGCDYQTALCVLKFLVGKGIAQNAGTRPSKAGKGKPSNLFSIPEGVVKLTLVDKT